MKVAVYRLWLLSEYGIAPEGMAAELRQQPGVAWCRVASVRWRR